VWKGGNIRRPGAAVWVNGLRAASRLLADDGHSHMGMTLCHLRRVKDPSPCHYARRTDRNWGNFGEDVDRDEAEENEGEQEVAEEEAAEE
jgi:hypothetical protein